MPPPTPAAAWAVRPRTATRPKCPEFTGTAAIRRAARPRSCLPGDAAGQGSGNGQGADGSAPEKPAGDGQNGSNTPPGSAPGGETETLTYESIAVGDTVTVIVGDDGQRQQRGAGRRPGRPRRCAGRQQQQAREL